MNSSTLTCLTCRVAFTSDVEHREHFKASDWHKYNLKRKCAGLDPVSLDIYERSVAAAKEKQSKNLEQKQKQADERAKLTKKAQKKLAGAEESSQKEFSTRLSRKDNETLAKIRDILKQQKDVDPADEASIRAVSAAVEQKKQLEFSLFHEGRCLFSLHEEGSLAANLEFMSKKFGFFLPDVDRVLDVGAFVKRLGEMVYRENQCIFCARQFYSVESVHRHMVDKQHCKLPDDFDEVFAEFYDYEWELVDDNGNVVELQEDDEWEEISNNGDDDDDEEWEDAEPQVPRADLERRRVDRRIVRINEYGELVLNSGKTAGSRKFKMYYRQSLRAPPSERDVKLRNQLLLEYKQQLGGEDRYRALVCHQQVGQRGRQAIFRSDREDHLQRNKSGVRLQLKRNKLQVHFRPHWSQISF